MAYEVKMRADSHREFNAKLIAWRVGARLIASVALFSLALAFGLVYDSGTFRSARAQTSAEDLPFAEGKEGTSRTVTINGVEAVFRWLPPGEFTMGSLENEEYRDDDETQHKVVITKGFWLAETETTQAFWKAVMGQDNNPSFNKGDNLPVEGVSWNDCQDFIKKLNEKTKDKGLRFRLPSEAHWEYACRAGTTTPFSFGSILNGDKANCDGNYPYGTSMTGKYVEKTTPVGSYDPNVWGLKDMHGNVCEWCSDWYGDYPVGTATDPEGHKGYPIRVIRGGCWIFEAGDCRSADRSRDTPDTRNDGLGFRLELSDVE